jgi:hypothetical protein
MIAKQLVDFPANRDQDARMKTAEERTLVARAMACGPGLRLLRKKNQGTLRSVAEQVRVHYSHLSRTECGRVGASVETLGNLARSYGFGSVKRLLACAEQMQKRTKQSKRAS